MATRNGQKIKLLHLADILMRHTDEEHPLTATQLCDKLAEVGVTAERKAIYDDIEQLIFFGYDIIQSRSAPRGYFLASRDFELPEIYLLADAVRSAKFISAKKTRELTSKLDSMLSLHQVYRREKKIFFDSSSKCDNEEIYYIIDGIDSAIEQHKKISFKYFTRALSQNREVVWKARELTVSPYAMTWQDDHYYLICNNEKYDNLLHLRIDRMRSVKITECTARPFSEVSNYRDAFDIADYTRKLFQMHSGPIEKITLNCKKKILEPILDRFSNGIFIERTDEETFSFSVEVAMSEALISWILSYGEDIKVLSPASLQERVIQRAQEILSKYR